MRFSLLARATLLLGILAAPGCGDDDGDDKPANSAGAGGSAGASGSSGQGGAAGGGAGGASGASGSSGQAGAAGGPGGDVGKACNPDVDDATCSFLCVETEPGKGVCTDTCGTGGNVPCEGGSYRCNELPGDGGEVLRLCLPNATCGELTFLGRCEGSKLSFCDVTGPATFDCAEEKDPGGQPLKCAELPGIGFDCVGQSYDGGCGAETEQGRCDGNTRVYCESIESGKVIKEPCGAGEQCVVALDGIVSCAPAGTQAEAACGSVTADGKCDGNTAVVCESGELTKTDCGGEQVCGFQGGKIGCYAKPAGGANRVKGSFVYEKRALTDEGLGSPTEQPVRRAVVKVLTKAEKKEVGSGVTGDDGSFDIQFDASEEVSVFVLSAAEPTQYGLVIRDCPTQQGCDGPSGNIYGSESDAFSPAADTDLGKKTITVDSGVAGAFSLYDIFLKGSDFAATNFGAKPPPVTVQWKAGSDTACQTSCYSSADKIIFIQGKESDTDEFDDPVLMHEWGHFLEDAFSRSDSPGGSHDGSPTDPRLAWGEGYGTFVGCAIAGSSKYIDTSAAGASVTQIDVTKFKAQPDDPKGMQQPLSEYTTAEILWKVAYGDGTAQGKGTEPIFDVLGKYFKRADFNDLDRGVQGVDLVDFLDGWYCREHASDELLKAVVSTNSQFPYDYKKLPVCK